MPAIPGILAEPQRAAAVTVKAKSARGDEMCAGKPCILPLRTTLGGRCVAGKD
jgi:hypothetical protein